MSKVPEIYASNTRQKYTVLLKAMSDLNSEGLENQCPRKKGEVRHYF